MHEHEQRAFFAYRLQLVCYVGKAPATKEDMQVVKDVMDGFRAMRTKNKPRWIL